MKPKPNTVTGIVIAVGIIAIVLGFYQLNQTIANPFSSLGESATNSINTRQELIALQGDDTDNDGLSDFDELYVYNTSPYISDSDSDGLNDDVEVSSGLDPNCPEGKICRTPPAVNTNELSNLFEINQNQNSNSDQNQNTNQSQLNPSVEEVSLDDLRATLVGAGIPSETLNNIDDDALRDLYAQALAEEQTTGNSNSIVNATTNSSSLTNQDVSLDDLQGLGADEIRTLFTLAGMPTESIDQLDDSTLKLIFGESIDEIKNNPELLDE
ncbi:hypothetical protein KKG41_04180 [Patescibacteria group bacterium]|nr:hypothetical protein [Patescibacteria group bacterium]MBU1890800.1 hypothetical protein [Patescibacteria group bacterium]